RRLGQRSSLAGPGWHAPFPSARSEGAHRGLRGRFSPGGRRAFGFTRARGTPKIPRPRMDAHRFHALGPALSLLLFAAAARSEPHRDARPQAAASTKADASTANASKAETTKAEPSNGDASKAEAARAETPKGDASKAGAAKAEAPKVEPSKPDAPKAEAGKGDASRADASKAEASEGGKQAMCAFEGRAEPRASTPIVDANGRVLARFSGAPTPLAVTQLPTHAGGLARVSTGTGTGSFRVHG